MPHFAGWLAEHPTDKFKCRCMACNVILKCGKSDLEKHRATKKHVERVNMKQNIPSVATFFSKNTVHCKKVATAEVKMANFLAHHNVSFQIIDHLVPVLKECFPDSDILRDCNLGRTKTTNVIKNVIAEEQSQGLIEILRNQYFSILIDESTDISVNKLLCVLAKYVDKHTGKCVTRLLELITVDGKNCDADHLYNAFKICLNKKNIPVNNIIGLASDNANVMLGKNNSFMTRLKDETRALIVIPCICHSAALVANKACLKLPRTPEEFIKSVASFFSMSAKRTAELREMQEYFKMSQLKMLKLSGTRWLSMQHAVQRVVENWQVLLNYFRLLKTEENSKTVDFIFDELNNTCTKAILLFLKYILRYFNTFNALFQSKKLLVHDLSFECRKLYKDILSHFIQPHLVTDFKINLQHPGNFLHLESINLGTECNEFVSGLPPDIKNHIWKSCLQFLIAASVELQNRFPLDNTFFDSLRFLKPDVALLDRPEHLKTLKHVYDNFNEIEDFDKMEVDIEWNSLLHYFDNELEKKRFMEKTIEDFWWSLRQVRNFEDKFEFKNLCYLASLCMTLPHSNAETERIFSVVTDVKNKKRNKISSEALNAVCSIRLSNESCCTHFSVNENHFNLMKKENLYKKND